MVPDTRDLVVEYDGPGIPDWAVAPVYEGARIVLEILEAERLPERVRIVGTLLSSESNDSNEPAVATHDDHEIVISYPAVLNPAYLGSLRPTRTTVERALAFCTGYRTACFVLSQPAWELPIWVREVSFEGDSDEHLEAQARAVAAIASGFSMVSDEADGDPRSEAVQFFLERLYSITRREGMAAAWRGAIGRATRALMREVRFGEIPGRVHVFGDRIEDPADVIRLIRYVGGETAWPFSPRIL